MNNQSTKIKYFAYLRKSSEQDDRQALSLSSQKDELEIFVKKEGLIIIEWIEEAHSAKHPDTRPKFKEMINRIKKGEAQGIITWNANRLSRNSVDTGTIIYLLDEKHLKEIRTPSQIFKDTPNDKFLLSLFCGQAKLENDNKGVDVRRGLTRKAKMGWRPNCAPIGYLNTPEKDKGFKTIQKDPEKFHLIRRMWDLMLTGNYTVPEIWKIAKGWGLVTQQRRRIGGKALSSSAVYTLFKNPFYYGWFQYNDTETNTPVWQKGNHEPMVTEEEFNVVQKLINNKGAPRPKENDFAFTGSLIRCASCRSSITAETKQKRQKNGNVHDYIYYHCTKKKDKNCVEKTLELKKLDGQILEILNNLTISEKFKTWAIKNLHEVRKEEAESNDKILNKRHQELESVTNQLEGLLLKFTSPENSSGMVISSEEYQTMKTILLKRKNALEQGLNAQGEEMEKWLELSEKTFNFACYSRIWYEKGDSKTKRSILGCLGSNLVLKDRKINVDIHPFFLSILESKNILNKENVFARTSDMPYDISDNSTFDTEFSTWLRG